MDALLSIEEIKNVSFRRANFGGYKPEDVDAFIDDVQISYEEMIREKENLLLMIDKLNQKINRFYEEDNSIKSVILSAQKIAEKSLNDAEIKTTDMMNKAAKASEKMINDAKQEVSINAEISEKLKLESANLRNQLEDIYKKHMDIISGIPNDISNIKGKESSDSLNIFSEEEQIPDVNSQHKAAHLKNEDEYSVAIDEEKISGGAGHAKSEIFSSIESESPHRKFKNLKFGKNFVKDEKEPEGVYFGIFRDKK